MRPATGRIAVAMRPAVSNIETVAAAPVTMSAVHGRTSNCRVACTRQRDGGPKAALPGDAGPLSSDDPTALPPPGSDRCDSPPRVEGAAPRAAAVSTAAPHEDGAGAPQCLPFKRLAAGGEGDASP